MKRVVPVEVIFSGVTSDHQKWQMFHHTMFRWAVLDTISLVFSIRRTSYVTMTGRPWRSEKQLKQLNLRGLVDIAIHGGGPFNTGRHQGSKIATMSTKYTVGVTVKPGWTASLISYDETRAILDIADVEDGVKDEGDGGERGFEDSATIQGGGTFVDEYPPRDKFEG
jgi:hypothetical protein